jgi:hypothetical protein
VSFAGWGVACRSSGSSAACPKLPAATGADDVASGATLRVNDGATQDAVMAYSPIGGGICTRRLVLLFPACRRRNVVGCPRAKNAARPS